MKKKQRAQVILFGRTNVGKSTLFNCLTETNRALVADIEGTTRDANEGLVQWQRKKFTLIDTGGIMDLKYLIGKKKAVEDIEAKVQKQVKTYLKKADLILFLVDAKVGSLAQDKEMALVLKKMFSDTNKIILVANKADSPRVKKDTAEFNKLGLGEPTAISAANGSGTGDLLDQIVKKIRSPRIAEMPPTDIRVAIIGKPNVGKSSLVNSILEKAVPGQNLREKIIVSNTPHTTREPQDVQIEYEKKHIKLIDTAGISKKGKKGAKQKRYKNTLEKFSIIKSLRILRHADIALLMIDINKTLTQQEAKLTEEIIKTDTSLIIVANKWDLVKLRDRKHYTQVVYSRLPFVTWAPIEFTSALTGAKIKNILDSILKTAEGRETTISANALNKFLKFAIRKHKPVKDRGIKPPFIHELTQVDKNPPYFSIRIGANDSINASYLRFLENQLRKKFGFYGTPVRVVVERNKKIHGQHSELIKKPKT